MKLKTAICCSHSSERQHDPIGLNIEIGLEYQTDRHETVAAATRHRTGGRNVAVGPDGNPLRVDRRRIGLDVTELLLLLGIQPPLTTNPFWRLVKAAVLVGHT